MAIIVATALGMSAPPPAGAQYIYIDADGDGRHGPGDRLQISTTLLRIYLDTRADRDGVIHGCDFGLGSLSIYSYEISLRVEGGTVEWGTMYDVLFGTGTSTTFRFNRTPEELTNPTAYHNGAYNPSFGLIAPGVYTLCEIPVRVLSGCPEIKFATTYPGNGAAFTSFGTECQADDEYSHTYILGRNWFDWDGVEPPPRSPTPPTIVGPTTISGDEGDAISVTAVGSDPDGEILSLSATGYPTSLTLSSTPSPSPVTATISGTLGFEDAGTHTITWIVSDGICGSTASISTTLTVADTDRAPEVFAPTSLDAPSGMLLTLDVSALDPDKDLLGSFQADLSGLPSHGGAVFRISNQQKTSGSLTWTPTVYEIGNTYPVIFTASNALTGSATTQIHVVPSPNPTGVESGAAPALSDALRQNRPNPFNPVTEIRFSLSRHAFVRLDVFTLDGRLVATLVDAEQSAGEHLIPWTGRDRSGRELASGVYLYRLQTDGFSASRRMVLLR